MKFNWGTGIVVAIIAFIAFIMFMVVTMLTDKGYEHDLVTENYYQKELTFQNKLDAEKNAKNLSESVKIERNTSGLKVIFPSNFNSNEIKGKVILYRPSNKKLDFEIPILTSNSELLIPKENLLGGRWNINVAFTYKNKEYLHKQELLY